MVLVLFHVKTRGIALSSSESENAKAAALSRLAILKQARVLAWALKIATFYQ